MVGEVEDLRKMMESLKRMVTGQGLEEKRGETGDQEASLEEVEEKEKEKSVGEKTRENSSTDNKDGKRIRPGAQMIATHDYKKNPESPVGNELDVNEGDTLVYLMTNENNEHWWLAEDGKGQVGYVPATYLKIIRDVTRQEEENDTAGKEGYGKKTDGSKIGGDMGQDGERRKTYSAAVIEGFKRNSAIYVGDSIVRKTDSRLTVADRGVSGPWGPQFCGALCNGETQRLLAGGAGSPPVGSEAEPRMQTHFGDNILKIG